MLNHIRVKNKTKNIWWNFKEDNNQYKFSASVSKGGKAKQIINHLEKFSADQIKYVYFKKELSFTCQPEQLTAICKLFDEKKIKKQFHPNDYLLYKKLKAEEKNQNKAPETANSELEAIKIEPNKRRFNGIAEAIEKDDVDAVETYLLTHSVNNKIDDQGNTALHLAVQHKTLKVIHYLCDTLKAYPLMKNMKGQQPLELALSTKNIEITRAILRNINHHALPNKLPPLYFSKQEIKGYFNNPQPLLKECERRYLESKERIDQINEDVAKLAEELNAVIKQSSKSAKERKRFATFWQDLCSVNPSKSLPLLGKAPPLKFLEHYFHAHIGKTAYLRKQIEFFGNVNEALRSGQETSNNWALEQIKDVALLANAKNSLSADNLDQLKANQEKS